MHKSQHWNTRNIKKQGNMITPMLHSSTDSNDTEAHEIPDKVFKGTIIKWPINSKKTLKRTKWIKEVRTGYAWEIQ